MFVLSDAFFLVVAYLVASQISVCSAALAKRVVRENISTIRLRRRKNDVSQLIGKRRKA
jgi:hypothetical protein